MAEQPKLAQAAWQLLGAQVAYLTEVPALQDTSFKAVEELFRWCGCMLTQAVAC